MLKFIKAEAVFCIALIAAIITSIINIPTQETLEAIDLRTLALLFSLMGVSEGFKASGIFTRTAYLLEARAGNIRRLSLFLILIIFFSSMLFTNDVALLMFVPFTLMVMDRENVRENYLIRLIVLETVSANLGSMATPVGNPQNLFIFSFFALSALDFFQTILPYSVLSLVFILIAARIMLPETEAIENRKGDKVQIDEKRSILYSIFLLVAILSVFHILDWRILFFLELVVMLLFDRKILFRIDYVLFFTFVCFFIFSANLRSLDVIKDILASAMGEHSIATSVLLSQIISNVPAAILLSPFTDDFKGVLIGTDIGGLGTPIASLASLISMKIYFKRENSDKKSYMITFLLLNFILLILLALMTFIF